MAEHATEGQRSLSGSHPSFEHRSKGTPKSSYLENRFLHQQLLNLFVDDVLSYLSVLPQEGPYSKGTNRRKSSRLLETANGVSSR